MHYSASKIKGRHLLSLWLDHLCLCASDRFSDDDKTTLVAADGLIEFKKLGASQAKIYLFDYVDLFEQGRNHIFPIFPDSSYAYAVEADIENAGRNAAKAWYQSSQYMVKGDSLDAYVQLALRGALQDPLSQPFFAECAYRIYQPLLENRIQL
jgi:exonuclease V gamma subunit